MPDISTVLGARQPLTLSGVAAGFVPVLLADLARAAPGGAVLIASDDAEMRAIAGTVPFFAPEIEVLQFPAWDCLPYDRASPSLRTMSERLGALHAIQTRPTRPRLFLTTVNAATQRTLTPFRIRQLVARLAPGERISLGKLAELLSANGYLRTDTVHDSGEFAVRGGLVDLWPSGSDSALRLDFFGDEIESVRTFDPTDQRTTGRIDGFTLLPASEALLDEASIKRFRGRYRERFGATATGDPLYQAVSEGRRLAGMEHWLPLFEERLETLFDHLPDDAVVVRDANAPAAAGSRFEGIADYQANRVRAQSTDVGSYRPLGTDQLYLLADEWAGLLKEARAHLISHFHEPASATVLDFEVDGPRDFAPERTAQANVYEAVVAHVAKLRKEGRKPILASYSIGARERLGGLLADHGLKGAAHADSWQEALGLAAKDAGKVALIVLPLDHGFTAPGIAVLTEQDMLGDRLIRRTKRKKSTDAFLAELSSLSPGDLVVHVDHGIGRYKGLTSIPVGQSPHDCVALEYAGGDKLYVPVENLDVLSRYGSGEEAATLDRLGGEAWQRRKSKMKERIREIAGELIIVAAKRATRPGQIAEPDSSGYPSFLDRFPYEETEDQDRAIEDVLGDLSAGKPMDRLVVGDVGFGKTEVALRAAFVAAMAGMQVAIVCPTTLLARQHYTNFSQRFEGFPIRIGRLSRLVPANEAKGVKEGLADGQVDIVIGTHALLSKGIDFKRLGLVVVDEEQRFGVTHKERLKALKADVHVLTLTATPIPRTLQMAMSGLRDLSVIQTPPVDRLAVRTYVMPWDPVVVREALLREHYRGGQAYFVTPKISDLPEIEEYLRREVPEIRYVVAHGQMAPTEVEERMSAFYDKKFEVLVSTTIVESGLDIPSANTMIINRADKFGLAQLYQLRGRVGRGKTRAYAYMTTPAERLMTVAADKRLKVLSDLESLGAGFQLASHDLDIRGAGNLLGDEQTGHIREVGYELYQSMLEEAIMDAKAGRTRDDGELQPGEFSPQITVDAPILIPETFVPDLDLRMGLYRRLNDVDDRPGIEAFAAEMIDRFGKLPEPTENLLVLMEAKLNAKRACIAKLDVGPRGALVAFHADKFPNVDGLLAYVARLEGSAKLRPDMKLAITRPFANPKARLNAALQITRGLAKAAG
ncbi:transcription-repair coupling factor [Sphingomonas sp. 37zxx]|uniref:transcription-repair coupling factor n=1 Tax=Sphingomonas sp. 37zxx TaxID=1550073 RepID=UPI00053BE90E|nr:transcription-repair coupling factor [Sphingomonas sp. 37zxx]